MSQPANTVTLDWCYNHRRWYVGDCPSCMVADLEQEKEGELQALRAKIEDLEFEIEELKGEHKEIH